MAKEGTKALASDVNSVFLRLEQLRSKHYNGTGQTAAGQAALANSFDTTTPKNNDKIDNDTISLMKQYLNTLRSSEFLTSITSSEVDKVTVPNAGDLIRFSSIETASNLVTTLEGMPSSFATNHTCFQNFGTNFTCFQNFGTDHSCFHNFGSDHSCFQNFGTNHSGHEATPHSCLSPYPSFNCSGGQR